MQAIAYTDTDQIRSVLGVDAKDMPDAQIMARALDKELKLELTRWLPSHSTLFTAGTIGTPGEAEVAIADALQLYSTYFCAVLVIPSTQLAAPQAVSDGKNSMTRFAVNDWGRMKLELQEKQAYYKDMLVELSASTVSSVGISLFSGVGLAVDPVVSS